MIELVLQKLRIFYRKRYISNFWKKKNSLIKRMDNSIKHTSPNLFSITIQIGKS